MSLFDKFKKVYTCRTRCFNCGHNQELKIPKGNTIDSYLKTESATCENCSCSTLRRIERIWVPANSKSLPEPVQVVDEYQRIKRAVAPSSSRKRMPPRPPRGYQVVEHPVNSPVAPEETQEQQPGPFEARPKKINFWTGEGSL